jgi:LysR family hydrogen peroxide-inducible transcriptional activator
MSAPIDSLPRGAWPSLRQLQFLVALQAQSSFVRAADSVGVTQPTLSAGIKELEIILAVVLVDRSRPGAHLSPAGEEAAARAGQILSAVEDMVQTVRGIDAPLVGPFRLGAIPTIAPFLLPQALRVLKARFPLLRLTLKEEVSARLIEALKARTLDAAFIALPYEAPGIDVAVVGEDEFMLATPGNHKLAHKADLSPADLVGEEVLLLDDGHCLRQHALSVCRLGPREGATDLGATSLHTLVQMVAGGMGVTLLPKIAVDAGVARAADVSIRSFQPQLIGRNLGVAWRAGGARAGDAQLIAETLKAAMAGGHRAD